MKLSNQKLELFTVTGPEFQEYGQVLEGYAISGFLQQLRNTPVPQEGVVYVQSEAQLEAEPVCAALQNRYFGGMPIQIGYCNGVNTMLNCLEYHRDSEVDIAADDCILLLARQGEIRDGKLDTSCVKAFFQPAGTAVELFATTLHYAPCSAKEGASFRVAIVLPLGTNGEKPEIQAENYEDTLMTARNKWLLAHADSNEAQHGAVAALTGPNLDLKEVLW